MEKNIESSDEYDNITVHCSSDLSFDGWWWLWLFFIFFWWLWWWNWTLRCLCPGDPSSGGPLPWQERMQGQFFNQYYLSKLTKSINIKSSHYWQLVFKGDSFPQSIGRGALHWTSHLPQAGSCTIYICSDVSYLHSLFYMYYTLYYTLYFVLILTFCAED